MLKACNQCDETNDKERNGGGIHAYCHASHIAPTYQYAPNNHEWYDCIDPVTPMRTRTYEADCEINPYHEKGGDYCQHGRQAMSRGVAPRTQYHIPHNCCEYEATYNDKIKDAPL